MKKIPFVQVFTVVLLLYIQTNLFAHINATYTKTDNTTCTPRQECICHGGLTSITVLYRGSSGVNIKVYRKNNFRNTYLVQSESSVLDGQIITVSMPAGSHFDSHAYFVIPGTRRQNVTKLNTSCGHLRLGETVGNYTIIGYTDSNGDSCNFPLCTGSIQLTVTGGAPPYSFSWNNGATSMNLDNLCNGKYKVRIKDGRGRTARAEITIDNDDSACNDNNVCTIDHCVNGTCRFIPIYCSDADQCTRDECDPVTGCFNSPVDCNDNDPCTMDRCHNGHCHNDKIKCDDHNDCTTDECLPNSGCLNVPVDCEDNDLCTIDRCHDGHCHNDEVECDDDNKCTKDECVDGVCVFTLDCSDDDLCTEDFCDDYKCKHVKNKCDDEDKCTKDKCEDGVCENKPKDCKDDKSCTLDYCEDGKCVHDDDYYCDDGDPCTNDKCHRDACENKPIHNCSDDPCAQINCDDNDACTINGCEAGQCHYASITCDDNDLCTSDLCANGECLNILADCNDGDNCTSDGCDQGQCIHIPIPGCGDPCANSNLAATASGNSPNPCNSCNGTATVNVIGGSAPYSYLWTTGETSQSIGNSQAGGVLNCINSGGLQYLSSANETFVADVNFAGNTFVYSRNNIPDIANTIDDELYFTERNSPDSMFYFIPVANGRYDVQLHFAELYFGVAGGNVTPPFEEKRVFDVFIEGILVLDNYDINADVGPAAATVKSFTTNVSDGILMIKFVSIINRAKISAICIKPENVAAGLCSGTYSVTVTDADGCTATDAVALCTEDPCLSINCDDNNACTLDECGGGECVHTLFICNDNDPCTDDQCENGQCSSSPISCNDNDACTADECNNGECFNTPSLEVSASGISPSPCDQCNGSAMAMPIGGAAPYSYLWSTGETSQSVGGESATTNRCINAGGTEYISLANDTFQTDWDYSGVTFAYSNNTIADITNTLDDQLFRSERNTMDSMSYNFPVTNGKYDVDLYFAELYFGVPGGNTTQPFTGKRIFDLFIEGVLVLDDYDINASVGPAAADIKTFTTTVSDQILSIKFVSVVNRAKISGICVRPSADQPVGLCSGTHHVTVTDANGCTVHATVNFCNGQKLSSNDLNYHQRAQSSGQIAKLTVYPVPFQETLKIDFRAFGNGEGQISIMDMLGKIVNSQKIAFEAGGNHTVIEIDNRFADGMYFMEFRTGGNAEYIKLYKSR